MKKKGFTLIELLAVIVILAIIALIAIPVITNVIEKAKKGAAESSAIGYINAVENQVAINAVDTSKEDIVDGDYEVSVLSTKGVTVKGNGPTSGTVTITKGQVTACSLVIDKYTVTCLGNGKVQVEIKEEEKYEEKEISVIAESLLGNSETYEYMNGTYLKGEQKNNYVWYNGFLWRFMGINENRTVRLITEENVGSVAYSAAGEALTYEENVGYAHTWLNEYFLSSLNQDYTYIIEENNEWCINSAQQAYSWCKDGRLYNATIGLMTNSEYILSRDSNNISYLNNGENSWTLSAINQVSVLIAHYSNASAHYDAHRPLGVRPIINVSNYAMITSGNGTLQSPYIVE